jgi:hypothetical protein
MGKVTITASVEFANEAEVLRNDPTFLFHSTSLALFFDLFDGIPVLGVFTESAQTACFHLRFLPKVLALSQQPTR